MKRILFILLIPILLLSCDMWNVDIVGFLEYYTNTAGIELIEYGGNYPEDKDGLVNIPSGAPRTITFTLRNPQSYNLNVSLVDWVDGNAPSTPDDYTIEQSPTNKSKITLTFTEDSLLSWDKSGGKNLSATVRIQDQESLRDFDDYVYTLAVNSPPITPSKVSLIKHDSVNENKWYLALNVGTTEDRIGIHKDIQTIRINNTDYEISIEDQGKITSNSALSIDNPSYAHILADNAGLAFIHSDNSIYLKTDVLGSKNATYTVSYIDTNGLVSDAVTVSSAGKVLSNFYVEEGAGSNGSGSVDSPYNTVQQAIERIFSENDRSSLYTIHIKGNVDGGSSDARGSGVLESDSTLNITLQGWGEDAQGTITAESGKRVLYVGGAGVNVTLGENLTLTGGSADNGGGVFVDRNARFTIAGAEIRDNAAVHGAGVYVENGTFSMTKGTIRSNIADDLSSNTGNGGGVNINAGTFSMTGGTIGGIQVSDANQADIDGGGIFINHGATVTIDGGTISGNIAGLAGGCSGGAIYVEDGATLTMKSGTISGNEADFGGAIAVNGDGTYNDDISTTERALFTLSSGTLSGNSAHNETSDSKGGAVFLSGNLASFIMNGGSIIDNEAVTDSGHNTYGGGVCVDEASFTLNKGEINGNTAVTKGGGVYVSDISTFTMNGGSIGSDGSPNTANLGGGVHLIDGDLTMSAGTISYNKATENGAGVYIENGSIFDLKGGSIRNNIATTNGGGIYIVDESTFTMNNANTRIEGNSALSGGGVYLFEGTFNLSAGTITSNKRANADDKGGGGVYIDHVNSNVTLNLSGAPFVTGNGVTGNPEAVDNLNFNSDSSSSPVKISGNLTGGKIGLTPLYRDGNEIVIQGGVTDANKNIFTSEIDGVSFYRVGSDLKVLPPTDEIYIGNTSIGNGDGLTSASRMAVTNQTQFNEAKAKFSRGSGTMWVENTLQVSETGTWQADVGENIILKRSSSYSGSLINVTNGELTLQSLTIDGQGGVNSLGGSVSATDPLIRVESGATLTLNDGATLQNNVNEGSTGEGGAIYSSGTVNLKGGSNIANNIADKLGNADNSPGKGGGVYANSGTINMYEGASIALNNANGNAALGGGVALFNSAIFNFYGGSISVNKNATDNSGTGGDNQKGAGIYIENSTLIMSGSTSIIRDNESDEGGGVYMESGELSMSAGSITGNNAYNNNPNGNGGGVYIAGGTLELSGSPKITGNTNDGEGINETANVYFTNSPSVSPIKITGNLEEDTSVSPSIVPAIGLSPSYKTAGYMLVQSSGGHDFEESYFTMDDTSIDLILYIEGNNVRLGQDEIYISRSGGGDGYSPESPMTVTNETEFAAAKAKLANRGGTMWVVGTLAVSSDGTWGADEGKAIMLKRYTTVSESLIQVNSGTLTLQNITLDGQGRVFADFDGDGDTEPGEGDSSAIASGSLISVESGANLTLGDGAVLQNNRTAMSGGGVYFNGQSLRMSGTAKIVGNIVSTTTYSASGGGVYIGSGTFLMSGSARISENNARSTKNSATGGGVYIDTGSISMSGSAGITNNEAEGSSALGGGLYSQSNTLHTINGDGAAGHALITGNTASASNDEALGGGAFLIGGTLSLSGNTDITGNSVDSRNQSIGGGVFGALQLGGNPTITNNTADGVTSNVFVDDDRPIEITAALTGEDNSIGISLLLPDNGTTVVTGLNQSSWEGAFFHDRGSAALYVDGNTLKLKTEFAVGDTGPGGGVVFDITSGAHKEIRQVDNTKYNWYEATGTDDNLANPDGDMNVAGDYAGGGYTDWYLPTIDELTAMWNVLGDGQSNIFDDMSSWYIWSVTDSDDNISQAWRLDCGSSTAGTPGVSAKANSKYNVFAVRSFYP